MKRCYFRFAQSVWRQMRDETLVDLYIENEALQLKMKMLAALAFVPPNLLFHYFEILQKDKPSKLEPLSDYSKTTIETAH